MANDRAGRRAGGVVIRLAREGVRMRIAIALTTLRPYQRRVIGLEGEAAREWLAEMLTERIMGRPESEAVILLPDLAGPTHSPRHGRWGEDEPHPHPEVPARDY